MKLKGKQKLVRIFVGEADKWKGRPLYQAIVDEARALGLAGATVFKGQLGYGANAHVHTAKLLDLSIDLPVCIEVVDSETNVERFLPALDMMVDEGLVTMETVDVLIYRAEAKKTRTARK